MKDENRRTISTPGNEFLPRKQTLFNLYLKMPVHFKGDWNLFRAYCREQDSEFEDVLGGLIIQFNEKQNPVKED